MIADMRRSHSFRRLGTGDAAGHHGRMNHHRILPALVLLAGLAATPALAQPAPTVCGSRVTTSWWSEAGGAGVYIYRVNVVAVSAVEIRGRFSRSGATTSPTFGNPQRLQRGMQMTLTPGTGRTILDAATLQGATTLLCRDIS